MEGKAMFLVASMLVLGFCHGIPARSHFNGYVPVAGGLNMIMEKTTAPAPCCAPKQYETLSVGLMGPNGKPEETVPEYLYLSYDAPRQMAAFNGAMYTDSGIEPYHLIQHFKENKMYFINSDGQCVVKPLTAKFAPLCIRPTAHTYVGRFSLGGGKDILTSDSWMCQRAAYLETASVTTDGQCIFLAESSWGHPDMSQNEYVPQLGAISYLNTTLGIKSEDVFTPPKVCAAGDIKVKGLMYHYISKFFAK